MTGWDILDTVIRFFPPIAAGGFFFVAGIVFVVGFFRHGLDFVKYGFRQKAIGDLVRKMDSSYGELGARMDSMQEKLNTRMDSMQEKLDARIDSMQEKLNTRIDGVQETVGAQIAGLRKDVDTRMDSMQEKLNTRIDSVQEKLDARIDSVQEKLDARMDTMQEKFDALQGDFSLLGGQMTATREDIGVLSTRVAAIETNHFGHLKNFLTELTGILVDRDIINNTEKARLDNELRGM